MAKILVVDDAPDLVDLVVRRLQNAGHRAQGANNAAAACAFVGDNGAPDLVVLDVTMPDVDGLELLGLLREQTGQADLPAIFLSGRVQPEDIAAGQALGATYLTKPYVGTALLGKVDAILAAQEAKRRPVDQKW